MNNKISTFIKDIRKEHRYSVLALADKVGITVQGLYKWLNKSDSEWNIDSLLVLSEILDFQVVINKGDVKIMRNDLKNTMVEENLYEVYEVYEDLDDYSVVYLYTPNTNLNYDEKPTLLEDDFFLFATESDCKKAFENCNPIKMYGLLDKKANSLIDGAPVDIYPYKVKTYYCYQLAANLEKTKDGYEVVEKFEDKGLQILKANLVIEDIDNRWELVRHHANIDKEPDGINGFLLAMIDDNNGIEVISWADNLEYLYSSINPLDCIISNRYFDLNRNEIFEGDILVKRGIVPENNFMYEEDYEDNMIVNKYFRNHETVRVERDQNVLVFDLKGIQHKLDELDLLMWEIIPQK